MKVIKFYLLIFLCLSAFGASPQQLTPPIQNYSTVDYDAASQNWDVGINDNGIIYFANNQGLLSYDGQRWDLYPLQTGSIVRSVYPYKDRIYIGSYREFGYWSRDKKGEMFYTSLIPLIEKNDMGSEEFWEILSYKGAIYFRSFGTIYKYEGNKVEKVLARQTNKMTVFKDRLLVAIGKDGLFFLNDDGSLDPLPNQETLQGKTIIDVLPSDDSLLIGSRKALYEFDGEKVSLYPDVRLMKEIKDAEFNHITQISDDQLVIGTHKNGVLIYHPSSGQYTLYNRNSGLQNNTILGIARRNGKIWLGLDNGITEVDINSPIKFYFDKTGELGKVYDMAKYHDDLYLASNTAVYSVNDKGLTLVKGAEGHTWNLEELDGTLYSNHNTGTYKIVNGAFVPVETGTGSFQIVKNPLKSNDYFIGTYTGISEYNSAEDKLRRLPNINFPVKKMVFENPSTIWAAHPYEGVYRINLPRTSGDTAQVHKLPNIEGKGNFKVEISRVNNQIALLNKDKWYRYNAFRDSLETFPELSSYKNHRLLYEGDGKFWFTNSENNSLIYTNFKDEKVTVSFQELNKRLVKGHENIIKINDSLFYVTLNDGYAAINLKELLRSKNREVVSKPIILEVSDVEKNYVLSKSPSIPYKNSNTIAIRAALPDSDASALKYKLTGSDKQTGEVKNGLLRFRNLKQGEYDLSLFSISPQNTRSDVVSYHFEVQPPWYLSNLMKLVYFLLFLGLISLIYWFNRFKLNKHQWLLEQKFEKEHQERLNKLEKQRLMNEITMKRKELANSTLMAAKKNEVLMEIQGELNKDKDKFSNQFRLKHIMNKINNAIKNKDEWQVFETNFNELHEDFFKDLLAEYPKLSSKDLKLCSYLKMNLTSKEIAPLMGISVRGVEVHRYRLRKKMDLDSKENLTNFLIKNF